MEIPFLGAYDAPEEPWRIGPFARSSPEVVYAYLSRHLRKVIDCSGLGRIDGELVGAVVSAANGCATCAAHHAEALYAFWDNPNRVGRVLQDFRTASLPLSTHLALSYAVRRAQRPEAPAGVEAARLRRVGFAEEDIRAIDRIARHVTRFNRLVKELWDGGPQTADR